MKYKKLEEDRYLVIPENNFDHRELGSLIRQLATGSDQALNILSKGTEFVCAISTHDALYLLSRDFREGTDVILSKFNAELLKYITEEKCALYFAQMVIKFNLTCDWPTWLPEYPSE